MPFSGIKNDLKGRLMCFKQDWTSGLTAGFRYNLFLDAITYIVSSLTNFDFCRILAPTTYIFFASAIPVISFGEQLERSTGMLSFLCIEIIIYGVDLTYITKNTCRWVNNCSSNSGFNCIMWDYALYNWRPTPANSWSCRTNCAYVYIHV